MKTSATFTGCIAIALWSVLALLTAASGTMPPFQLAAITFAIGGGFGLAFAAARGQNPNNFRQIRLRVCTPAQQFRGRFQATD